MRITVDGVGLEVEEHGAGPAVLFVHGNPDNRHLWRSQVRAVTAQGFRALTLDVRGYGDSDKPTQTSAYDAVPQVVDLMHVLDHFRAERAHVVGHDWGAVSSWALAAFHPERVLSLTAMAVGHPHAFTDAGFVQMEKAWYMLMFQFPEAEQWLAQNDFANLRHLMRSHPEIDAVVERLRDPAALAASLQVYRSYLAPSSFVTPPMVFPPVTVPVMGVWGAEDHFNTEEAMLGSPRYIDATWRYERMDGVGHWMPLEAPERVNELLLDFLTSYAMAPGQDPKAIAV